MQLPLGIGLLQMKSNRTPPKIMHSHILFQQHEQKNYGVWDSKWYACPPDLPQKQHSFVP